MCSQSDDPSMHDTLRPVGTDTDGNGIWTDGTETWNSGEPLTDAERDEANAAEDERINRLIAEKYPALHRMFHVPPEDKPIE